MKFDANKTWISLTRERRNTLWRIYPLAVAPPALAPSRWIDCEEASEERSTRVSCSTKVLTSVDSQIANMRMPALFASLEIMGGLVVAIDSSVLIIRKASVDTAKNVQDDIGVFFVTIDIKWGNRVGLSTDE
jgi:hypothetical protein